MEIKPKIGMRVIFGHLMLEETRKGTIVDIKSLNDCTVEVQPNLKDEMPEGSTKTVTHCLFFEQKPEKIPASHWQYCYPEEI